MPSSCSDSPQAGECSTVRGRHMEYLIDARDGKILGTELPIHFRQLPAPVLTAAQKHFGATTGLTVMKGVEFGRTQYEIEGMRNGRRIEVAFDPVGNRRNESYAWSRVTRLMIHTIPGTVKLPVSDRTLRSKVVARTQSHSKSLIRERRPGRMAVHEVSGDPCKPVVLELIDKVRPDKIA